MRSAPCSRGVTTMRERRWRRGMRALLVAAATLPALLVAGCVSVPFSSGVEVGGAVELLSEPGTGTTLRLVVPR